MRERAFELSPDKTSFIRDMAGRSADLAKALEVSPQRLSHYLLGRRYIPETLLMALCRETARKPSDFLTEPAEKIIADNA